MSTPRRRMRIPVMQFQSMLTGEPMGINIMGREVIQYTVQQQQQNPVANNKPSHQLQEDQTLDGTSGRDE